MSDQDQETYRLTLLGLLQVQLGDEVGREIYDALELYCRRNSCGMARVTVFVLASTRKYSSSIPIWYFAVRGHLRNVDARASNCGPLETQGVRPLVPHARA